MFANLYSSKDSAHCGIPQCYHEAEGHRFYVWLSMHGYFSRQCSDLCRYCWRVLVINKLWDSYIVLRSAAKGFKLKILAVILAANIT